MEQVPNAVIPANEANPLWSGGCVEPSESAAQAHAVERCCKIDDPEHVLLGSDGARSRVVNEWSPRAVDFFCEAQC